MDKPEEVNIKDLRLSDDAKDKNDLNDIKSNKKGIIEEGVTSKREKRKEGFLENLENGVSVLKASKASGIGYKTIWRWRKEDPEFDAAVMAILDSRIMIVEDALYLNAAKGNLGAQIFWLKNRSGGRWKDKIEEDVNLNVKGGLNYNEYKNFKGMTKDERAAFIAELSEIVRTEGTGDIGKDQGNDQEESLAVEEDNIS